MPAPWYDTCTSSVRRFARLNGFDYRWLDDELFDVLPERLREKTRRQTVVATDLARLAVLEAAIAEGFERVVWIDADVLVLVPERLSLLDTGAQFGREVWVQKEPSGRLKVYRRIHNAFMSFRRGDPVLPFYRFAAERIVDRFVPDDRGMVPQLVGPKLLTHLHNAIGFDVLESVGMLSPLVVRDLLSGGGPALERFAAASEIAPVAVNVCGSSVASGELDDDQMQQLVARLSAGPELLAV